MNFIFLEQNFKFALNSPEKVLKKVRKIFFK